MKMNNPDDRPLYNELLDLSIKFNSTMEYLQVYFTDAANSIIEGDYMTTDQHLSNIYSCHSELNVYILAAIGAFKKYTGEWA